MSKIGDILKELLARHKLSVSGLARLTNLHQPVVHRLIAGNTGNPKIETLRPLARYFNISIDQLLGDAPLPETSGKKSGVVVRDLVPLPILSFEQLLHWPNQQLMVPTETILTELSLAPNAFAVRLRDSAMSPRFTPKTLLIVDPGQELEDDDLVMVRLHEKNSAVFRQLTQKRGRLYLVAFNSEFPTVLLRPQDRILGVMVQARIEAGG